MTINFLPGDLITANKSFYENTLGNLSPSPELSQTLETVGNLIGANATVLQQLVNLLRWLLARLN